MTSCVPVLGNGVWNQVSPAYCLPSCPKYDRGWAAHRVPCATTARAMRDAVEQWLASHPRVELLFLPTYCPKASPLERAFGDVHDKCTRNHQRKRLWTLVRDVKQHLSVNGPWRYELSEIYYTPEVTAAVQALLATQTTPEEISQLAA